MRGQAIGVVYRIASRLRAPDGALRPNEAAGRDDGSSPSSAPIDKFGHDVVVDLQEYKNERIDQAVQRRRP